MNTNAPANPMSHRSAPRSVSMASRGAVLNTVAVLGIMRRRQIRHPEALSWTWSGRASKDDGPQLAARRRPSPFEAPPAQEAGVAPQGDGPNVSCVAVAGINTRARAWRGG